MDEFEDKRLVWRHFLADIRLNNDNAEKAIQETGFLDREIVELRKAWMDGEGQKFAETMKEMTDRVKSMGPSPYSQG